MIYRDAEIKDREFILNANREINELSGLNDSSFENRIDDDLFKNKVFKSIVVEINNDLVGFVLYSYVYWANCGKGIYLSQAYVKSEYRGQGIYKNLIKELEKKENDCNFITDLVGTNNVVMKNVLDKLEFKSSNLVTYYKMIDK